MVKKEKLARMCKEHVVDEIVARLEKHPNFLITNYMGLSVGELEQLRRDLKKSSSSYFVVKNSALKVIFEKLKIEGAASLIDSGMGLSVSGNDIVSTCKTVATFKKDHNKLKIKGGFIDGKLLPPEKVSALAALPPKEILLAQVVGGIKSPITGFVNTLSGVLRKFVYVVDAIKTSKEKTAASAPASPAAQG